MITKCLLRQTAGVGVILVLSGCEVFQSAGNDLSRLRSTVSGTPQARSAVSNAPSTRTVVAQSTTARSASDPARTDAARVDGRAIADDQSSVKRPAPSVATAPSNITIVGKSEGELRALFGPPSKEEDRAPGKTWRYRDGRCSMDVQLYPDVQTKKYGTLAYEVKSDDNTDEGKRNCLAQFRSRAQGRGG
jgi:hypothetical protein